MSNPKFEDYNVEIRRLAAGDGGGYVITFPDLPGCLSDGETPDEALANGRDAFEAWMEACRSENRLIPAPGLRAQEADRLANAPGLPAAEQNVLAPVRDRTFARKHWLSGQKQS